MVALKAVKFLSDSGLFWLGSVVVEARSEPQMNKEPSETPAPPLPSSSDVTGSKPPDVVHQAAMQHLQAMTLGNPIQMMAQQPEKHANSTSGGGAQRQEILEMLQEAMQGDCTRNMTAPYLCLSKVQCRYHTQPCGP